METMLSNCCNAPMRVEGRTTKYYVCTRCQRSCDARNDCGFVKKQKGVTDEIRGHTTPNAEELFKKISDKKGSEG